MSLVTAALVSLFLLTSFSSLYWYRACVIAHRQQTRLRHILTKSDGGILCRRTENRALLRSLLEQDPELLRRHPQIIAVAKLHDLHFSALATLLTHTEWHDLPSCPEPWPAAQIRDLGQTRLEDRPDVLHQHSQSTLNQTATR